MTGPIKIQLRTPADAIRSVPRVLGFTPSHSLVMLTFGSPGGSFHARVDFEQDHAGEAGGLLLAPAVDNGVRQVLLMAWHPDREMCLISMPVIADAFIERGIEVVEVIVYDAGHYASLDPRLGAWVREGAVSDEEMAELHVIERADLSAPLLADTDNLLPIPLVDSLESSMAEVLIDRVLSGGHLTDQQTADLLATMLASEQVRDHWLDTLTRHNAQAGVEFFTGVLGRVEAPNLRGLVAARLALCAWLAGHGALAWDALGEVEKIEADNTLADLVAMTLEHVVNPSLWDQFRAQM